MVHIQGDLRRLSKIQKLTCTSRRKFLDIYQRDKEAVTPSFAVVKRYIYNIRALELHNGGNDTFWEVCCTFRPINQGLGLSQYTGMERFQSSKSLAATRRVEGGKVTEKGPLRVKAGEKGRFREAPA